MTGTFIDGEEQGGNKGLSVRFFMHAIQDERRSMEEGRPIYKEIEMVEILTPGSRDILHKAVTEVEKHRFKELYKQFRETKESRIDGTPLDQFPFISVAERKELEYFNIFTGEQLVNIPDGNIDKIGVNGRDLIKKVEAYIKFTKDNAHIAKTTQENEELKREIALLKQQMAKIMKVKEEDNGEKAKRKNG